MDSIQQQSRETNIILPASPTWLCGQNTFSQKRHHIRLSLPCKHNKIIHWGKAFLPPISFWEQTQEKVSAKRNSEHKVCGRWPQLLAHVRKESRPATAAGSCCSCYNSCKRTCATPCYLSQSHPNSGMAPYNIYFTIKSTLFFTSFYDQTINMGIQNSQVCNIDVQPK